MKSDREFRIEKVTLLSANGAVISEIRQRDWETLSSKGFRVVLPQDKIVRLWNDSSGPRNGWATGAIGVEVSCGGTSVDLSLPFMAKQDFDVQGSTTYAWIRLTG